MSQEPSSFIKKQKNQVLSILQKKRDGKDLSSSEIKWWVDEYTQDKIPDYQMAALLMAIYLNGLNHDETAALTDAMLYSGKILAPLGPSAVDKHSTGGVGDKTSFIVAPLAAANGVKVPMIAGRGLGHTGGTVDKIESIKGFDTTPSLDKFYRQVQSINLALSGATIEIAPADKKIYALRDVTETVASIPLITASIMSKKLAEGTSGIVMDVKTGQGAFMTTLEESQKLAQSLRQTAKRFHKNIMTVISDMDQPLGQAIGNSLEIIESIEILKGKGPEDLRELSIELAGGMIYLAKQASNHDAGKKMAEKSLEDGTGLSYFRQLIEAQGGDGGYVDDYTKFPVASCQLDIQANETGFLHSMDCRQLGLFCTLLGGGRKTKEDSIDPAVGLIFHKKITDKVEKGETILSIYHHKNQEDTANQIKEQIITNNLVIKKEKPDKKKLIKEIKTLWV